MKNGDLLKKKKEYLKTRFQTREGLVDFFVGSAVWAILIVNYSTAVFNAIHEFLGFLPYEFLAKYAAYLVFGVVTAGVGLAISTVIIKAFTELRRLLK